MASDIIIKDGGGNGRACTVSAFYRLNVSAKTNPRIFYESRDSGQSYNLTSIVTSASAGDYCIYIKNTSTSSNLYVRSIEYHSDQDVKWLVWSVTGTPTGTALEPANLNLGSGNLAEATAYGDATVGGLTTKTRLATHRSQAGGEGEMHFDDALILTPNTAIAVEYDSGTTGACELDLFFHFEEIGKK